MSILVPGDRSFSAGIGAAAPFARDSLEYLDAARQVSLDW